MEFQRWITEHQEKLTLVLLILVITSYRLLHFQGFVVPSCDYEQYRAQAVALANGDIATDTPIAPGTSIVMMALSPLLPGPDPYLQANLAANLIAGTALIVFLWYITRQFLPVAFAAIATWLFAYNPETTAVCLQPGSDVLFVTFIILAFMLYLRDSPWAYAAGGTAALFRYHGVLVLFALVLGNLIRHRSHWREIAYSAASIIPTATWYWLLATASETLPYVGARGKGGEIETGFFKSVAAATLETLPRSFAEALKNGDISAHAFALGCLTLLFVVGLIGIWAFWSTKREQILPLMAFTVAVFGLHMFIEPAPQRYTLPILWILHLCIMGGLANLLISRSNRENLCVSKRHLTIGLVVGAAFLACWVFWPPVNIRPGWAVLFGIPLLVGGTGLIRGRWPWRSRVSWVTLVSIVVATLFLSASTFDYTVYATKRVQKYYAELWPFSKWYHEIQQPGDLILCYKGVKGYLIEPQFGVSPDCIISACKFDQRHFLEQLDELDVDYVLWTETSFITQGLSPSQNRIEYFAEECNKWFFQDLISGRADWREVRRFSYRERTAKVFVPNSGRPEARETASEP